jgi:hypothetical protein
MRENTYRTHQKILGAVFIAYSIMNIFGAITILAAFSFIFSFIDEPDLIPFIAFMLKFISISMLVVAVPAIIGGVGMLKEKEWAKNLVMIVGIFYLISIPVGTAVGIYAIWFSTQQVIKDKEPLYATDLVKHAH